MKMRKNTEYMTDEEVDAEIKRLTVDEHVRLARAEQREKYRKRQYLYQLRALEKRGIQLEAEGYTPYFEDREDEDQTEPTIGELKRKFPHVPEKMLMNM